MKHGIAKQIPEILQKNGPSTARQVSELVQTPEGWSDEKLRQNVAVMLAYGAREKKWSRVERGRYAI